MFPSRSRPRPAPALLGLLLAAGLPLPFAAAPARASGATVALSCPGTVLQVRGRAERRSPVSRLAVSLSVTAEAASREAALADLQRRLAAVREALQDRGVASLEITAPATGRQQRSRDDDVRFTARVRVSGELPASRLQSLVSGVGSLPGVRLFPARPLADPATVASLRRALIGEAYRQALAEARAIAAAIGRSRLDPLEVQLDPGSLPRPLRAAADAAPPPFDPGELPAPTERLGLQARFCAR